MVHYYEFKHKNIIRINHTFFSFYTQVFLSFYEQSLMFLNFCYVYKRRHFSYNYGVIDSFFRDRMLLHSLQQDSLLIQRSRRSWLPSLPHWQNEIPTNPNRKLLNHFHQISRSCCLVIPQHQSYQAKAIVRLKHDQLQSFRYEYRVFS